jgi:hypothetical protein
VPEDRHGRPSPAEAGEDVPHRTTDGVPEDRHGRPSPAEAGEDVPHRTTDGVPEDRYGRPSPAEAGEDVPHRTTDGVPDDHHGRPSPAEAGEDVPHQQSDGVPGRRHARAPPAEAGGERSRRLPSGCPRSRQTSSRPMQTSEGSKRAPSHSTSQLPWPKPRRRACAVFGHTPGADRRSTTGVVGNPSHTAQSVHFLHATTRTPDDRTRPHGVSTARPAVLSTARLLLEKAAMTVTSGRPAYDGTEAPTGWRAADRHGRGRRQMPFPSSRIESQELGASPCTRTICGMQALSHGVWYPTTLAEAGSDLHQACLTWLCCAFRFSQPLDALIPPATSPALFHAGNALGLSLPEVFPPR